MIEVVFGESEAGAMKAAIQNEKSESDVICLGFALDIGDIQKPVTGEYRAKLLYNLLYQKQWGADREMKSELKKIGNTYSEEFSRLREHLDNGEPIRIRYSSAPYSLCGMMWLCSELGSSRSTVSAVSLPRVTVRGNTTVIYSSWGDVEPSGLGLFHDWERVLSPAEITAYARHWAKLKYENAPLRAVVNGSLVSVPASFYDFLILKDLGDRPVQEALLIGKILGENQLGIGDWWYSRRIDKLIEQNRIKIIENSPRKYERLIAKNST